MNEKNFDIDDIITAINNGSIPSVKKVDWKNLAIAAYQSEHAQEPLPFILFLHALITPIHIRDYRVDILYTIEEHLDEYLQGQNASPKELKRLKEECRLLASYLRYVNYLIPYYDEAGRIYAQNRNKDQMEVEAYIYYTMLCQPKEIKEYFALSQTLYTFMTRKTIVPVKPLTMPVYTAFFKDKIITQDIIEFCNALLITEHWRRRYLAQQPIPLVTVRDFPLALRNACFEEYIRFRLKEINNELLEDNDRLYPPTEQDCRKELYEREEQAYNQLAGIAQFKGSQAYSEIWRPTTPDVLRMAELFLAYLKGKGQERTVINRPDRHIFVKGNYIEHQEIGTQIIGAGKIDIIQPGGVGKQVYYGVQKPQRPAAAPTNTEKRESAPFEPDFMTFTKERTSDYNIIALYQELLKVKWIEDGNPDDFAALFEGKNTECRITWSGKVGKDNLYALFKMMVDNHFIRLPEGHSLQRIVESHFVDAEGNYITGIDSGKPSKSALSTIEQMRKILAARQTFDD